MEPVNNIINPLLTDFYQLTMCYAYWKNNKHNDWAIFDLFFRKNPFKGEFTIFAGLNECLKFIDSFNINDEQINYIKQIIPNCESDFYDWLKSLDCSKLKIYAIKEGSVVFPQVPLLRVEGPLGIAQIIETTLLTLINYSSLVATNAARHRLAAGSNKILVEFGLRRAQGPDGGLSASRYSYIGGFDGTSNVLAGQLFGIPVKGTHAHSFVQSHISIEDLKDKTLKDINGKIHNFVDIVFEIRNELNYTNTNIGELVAFISYAQAFPNNFLCLVDSYDTINSGIPNFICVALALIKLGYKPVGIRLDSGDLSYLSITARNMFKEVSKKVGVDISNLLIFASNDINEETILSLEQQGNEINAFGIGTNLVTCQTQPALGCVYKLVEINGKPRIKISQDVTKITIPGKKEAYRLIGEQDYAVMDLLILENEDKPIKNTKIFARHPFNPTKRAYIIPKDVIPLHECVWDGGIKIKLPTLHEIRDYVFKQLKILRKDHTRNLNPTPYKVGVSEKLYNFIHELWQREMPIPEIK